MSLIRQLWLAVILIALLAFCGSFAVSTLMARSYVEQQLLRQNIDTANSLALSMSQQSKDRATVELQVAALFDTGHYQSISVLDPFGKKIVERVQTRSDVDAPAWLVHLLPIDAAPGRAQVTDGWKQFGVVNVVSHSKFAYRSLWNGLMQLAGWFVLAALVSGVVGTLIIRNIRRPLEAAVEQAHAISERRFTEIEEPRIPELRSMVRALNDMVKRLRQMFSDEAARLDALRHKVNHDEVTGLSTRDYFMAHLHEIMTSGDSSPVGSFVLVRLVDLDRINQVLGRKRADELLKELGAVLWASGEGHRDQRAGRLNGAEFAVVCPTFESAHAAATDIFERLNRDFLPHWSAHVPNLFHVCAASYRRGQSPGSVLALADQALAIAQSKGPNTCHAEEKEAAADALPAEQWRTLLTGALEGGRLELTLLPVVTMDGKAMHQQSVMRLRTAAAAPLLSGGDFMPMAVRFNLTAPLNLDVVKLALRQLETPGTEVAVTLSGETLADSGFRSGLGALLKAHPTVRNRLWLDVPEWSVFRYFDAFQELCTMLRGLGCRVGIEHFGQRFAQGQKLAGLGLHYVKVHPSYVRDIDRNPDNREFLKGLCNVAHAIGIVVIAVDVQTPAELAMLRELGFDGAAGPAIRQ